MVLLPLDQLLQSMAESAQASTALLTEHLQYTPLVCESIIPLEIATADTQAVVDR